MDLYLLDWANLLVRWLHVVVAIAWIGASFYFVWLDNHLQPATDAAARERGVMGEVWAVHGGGFYNAQKYRAGPPAMPEKLHWFYWESYWTWMSGFALFSLIYLAQPSVYLIDPTRMDWHPAAAVAVALGFLVAGWVIYDLICRTLGRTAEGGVGNDGRVGVAVFGLVVIAAWLAEQWFAARAASLLVGAMLATLMSANVLMVIIPGQKRMVAALAAGRAPNPLDGQRGKQRSVHNTYLTLPVLVAMLSNHFPVLQQGRGTWLALVALMLAGALVRGWFVARHRGQPSTWWWVAATALIAAVAIARAPAPRPAAPQAERPSDARIAELVAQRCLPCHSAALASKDVRLDGPEHLATHRARIYQQVVVQRLMPLNNATGMSEEERAMIAAWAAPR